MQKTNLIRASYPSPSPFPRTPLYGQMEGEYCVAGAFTLARHYFRAVEESDFSTRFPSVRPLADALLEENPSLSEHEALEFASRIVDHNDIQEFEVAWQTLEEALGSPLEEITNRGGTVGIQPE